MIENEAIKLDGENETVKIDGENEAVTVDGEYVPEMINNKNDEKQDEDNAPLKIDVILQDKAIMKATLKSLKSSYHQFTV